MISDGDTYTPGPEFPVTLKGGPHDGRVVMLEKGSAVVFIYRNKPGQHTYDAKGNYIVKTSYQRKVSDE